MILIININITIIIVITIIISMIVKVEKDNTMDRSDVCEQAAKDAKVEILIS